MLSTNSLLKGLAFAFGSEGAAVPTIRETVEPGSTIYADEASCYDQLAAHYETKRVNHSVAYSHDGACTNQAESFFSRLRRAEIGIHHKIAGPYLAAYAAEMDWRWSLGDGWDRNFIGRHAHAHQGSFVGLLANDDFS